MVATTLTRARVPGEVETSAPGPRDVLVVEDDDFIRHALRRILSADGRTCVAAATVESAQQLLAVHQPALVITDLNLGGRLDGIDLIAWMRRSPRLRAVPALLMTGEDRDETRRRLDGAGLAHVEILSKPFERDALAALLERMTR